MRIAAHSLPRLVADAECPMGSKRVERVSDEASHPPLP